MRLRLDRPLAWQKEEYTIGRLYVDGMRLCNTLELPVGTNRPRTDAIPAGIYTVILAYSGRFRRVLPLVTGVPGRSGILIHKGNTVKDTKGCILPGENTKVGKVLNSTYYENEIVRLLKEAEGRGEISTLYVRDA